MLAGSGLITTRDKCGERGSTTGLGNHPQRLPKDVLRPDDRVVRNRDDVVQEARGDRVDERANAAWCERICRDPTSRGIDWSSCLERHRQRWGGFRLDADHPDLAAKPSRDAGDKPAASNCDEERVDIGALLLDLQPYCCLAQQCFTLVESVDGERS